MHPPRHLPFRSRATGRGAVRALHAGAATVLCVLLASCAPTAPNVGSVPEPEPGRAIYIANHWGSQLEFAQTDVPYGDAEHQRLDVLPTTSTTRRGTIVFVHGGGFLGGDRSELLGGNHGAVVYQSTRGWDIVSVGYLVQENSYPTPYHDVALAVSWLQQHGESIGLDTAKVMLVGHSAGGSLAAMVATTPGATTPHGPVPRVDGWVSVSALHDWENGGRYISDPWGLPAGHRVRMSPITTLDRTDPPGYLIHADEDPIVRPGHSANLYQRARQVRAAVQFDLVDAGPMECRSHTPLCGANLASLNAFLR